MALRPAAKIAIDAAIAGLLIDIATAQATYKATDRTDTRFTSGRYKSEGRTHDTIPRDGATRARARDWDIVTLPTNLPCMADMVSYVVNTPGVGLEHGYYVHAFAEDGAGVTWVKSYHGIGPRPDVADFTDWGQVAVG